MSHCVGNRVCEKQKVNCMCASFSLGLLAPSIVLCCVDPLCLGFRFALKVAVVNYSLRQKVLWIIHKERVILRQSDEISCCHAL